MPPPTGIERALQEQRVLLVRLVLGLFWFSYTPDTHLRISLSHKQTHKNWRKAVIENFWNKGRKKEIPDGKNRMYFTKERKKETTSALLASNSHNFTAQPCPGGVAMATHDGKSAGLKSGSRRVWREGGGVCVQGRLRRADLSVPLWSQHCSPSLAFACVLMSVFVCVRAVGARSTSLC